MFEIRTHVSIHFFVHSMKYLTTDAILWLANYMWRTLDWSRPPRIHNPIPRLRCSQNLACARILERTRCWRHCTSGKGQGYCVATRKIKQDPVNKTKEMNIYIDSKKGLIILTNIRELIQNGIYMQETNHLMAINVDVSCKLIWTYTPL